MFSEKILINVILNEKPLASAKEHLRAPVSGWLELRKKPHMEELRCSE